MNHSALFFISSKKHLVFWVFILALYFINCQHNKIVKKPIVQKNDTISGKVIKIIDGDTYDILLEGNKQIRIRMEGIDAPEKGMPYYKVAKNYLKEMCITQQVKVVVTGSDNQDRKIAYTYLNDGRELSREMLKAGLAWHFIKYNTDKDLAAIQSEAQNRKIGIWSQQNPMSPWENRRLHRIGISTKDSFK